MKDFDKWNTEKKKIELKDSKKIKCHKRQIWLCKIWENIWSEVSKSENFIRPVLILKVLKWGLVLILPLTTIYKETFNKELLEIKTKNCWLNKKSYLMLNQIKVISKKRLIRNLSSNNQLIELSILKDKLNFI